MEIIYKNKKARQQFESKYASKWTYPRKVKEKILSIGNFLESAESLNDIFAYPPYRFHSLKGDRKGEWSISVGNTGWRVTIIPCDENKNAILNGDVLAQCKFIKIVMVTEVSNHYE